ncbi:porin [Planktomarina temperata]|nr:porin [Planktomarina temperata]
MLNKTVYFRDLHPSEPIIFTSENLYTKRILLTTTSLVLAAGVAQADVSFSGTAGVALIDDNGASDATRVDMFFESYYDFDITASAESDNGVSVSLGFGMGSGNKIDYNDDDELEAQTSTVGDANVAVSYAGWTLTVDQAGIDNLFDDGDGAQDVSIAGSIAGWSVAMTSDQEGSTSSYKVGGNIAGVALTLTGTDVAAVGGDASKIAASYNMGNGLTLSASSQNEDGTAEDDATVGFSYAMDALTVGYTSIQPGGGSFGDEWDASVKYTAGALVASFAIDEADATTIIADFALGGGASAFAAMHDKDGTADDLTTVGLNFAF